MSKRMPSRSARPNRSPRGGFTLVELLATIAVIGVLVGLIVPAVQSSREAANRHACLNNLRQIGLASQNHEAFRGYFPIGSVSQEVPGDDQAPWTFYRWSGLAQLTPFMEKSVVYNSLDLSVPLYTATFQIGAENADIVSIIVPEFLCPSDRESRLVEDFGPTNYALSTGSGINGGSSRNTDGISYINSRTRIAQITDGTSNTVFASESVLGVPQQTGHDPQTEYKFSFVSPLTENFCNASIQWNVSLPRGFSWVNGEYRCTLYNHYAVPNSPVPDCLGVTIGGPPERRFMPWGWRAARSSHPDGVNVAMADGSAHFIRETIDLSVWRAASTIQGGETESL